MALRKAVIIAGGFGTRMQSLTNGGSKLMLPLQGKPILEYSIDMCKRYGITEIAMSVFHCKDTIKEYFGDGSRFGVSITYFEEPEPLGTAGVLRLYKDWLDQPFLMCNADELKDINLHDMYRHHVLSGGLATDALFYAEDPSSYGTVELDGERIVRFVEKPKKEEAPSNFCNAGLYIMDPKIISYIPEGFCMVEKEVFPRLAAEGNLYGYKFMGQWFDTGTPERYYSALEKWQGFRETPFVDVRADKAPVLAE
jgi:NDP-sugar pyrophosphorylase family protein